MVRAWNFRQPGSSYQLWLAGLLRNGWSRRHWAACPIGGSGRYGSPWAIRRVVSLTPLDGLDGAIRSATGLKVGGDLLSRGRSRPMTRMLAAASTRDHGRTSPARGFCRGVFSAGVGRKGARRATGSVIGGTSQRESKRRAAAEALANSGHPVQDYRAAWPRPGW